MRGPLRNPKHGPKCPAHEVRDNNNSKSNNNKNNNIHQIFKNARNNDEETHQTHEKYLWKKSPIIIKDAQNVAPPTHPPPSKHRKVFPKHLLQNRVEQTS